MRASLSAAVVALAPLALALSGCGRAAASGEKPGSDEAAQLTVVTDVSASVALLTSPSFSERAIALAGSEFGKFRLGDSAMVIAAGDLSVDHSVNPSPIVTGYHLRIPAAKRRLAEELSALRAKYQDNGGDSSTNLIYALENGKPVCTPRSELVIISDGIEESEAYSVTRAFSTRRPVQLPSPPSGYLKGCSVRMIGIGVMGGESQSALPVDKMRSLQQGWRKYFEAAGVRPSDIEFRSII